MAGRQKCVYGSVAFGAFGAFGVGGVKIGVGMGFYFQCINIFCAQYPVVLSIIVALVSGVPLERWHEMVRLLCTWTTSVSWISFNHG